MSLLFGIIFVATAITWNVSADARLICLCLWLIAAVIEVYK